MCGWPNNDTPRRSGSITELHEEHHHDAKPRGNSQLQFRCRIQRLYAFHSSCCVQGLFWHGSARERTTEYRNGPVQHTARSLSYQRLFRTRTTKRTLQGLGLLSTAAASWKAKPHTNSKFGGPTCLKRQTHRHHFPSARKRSQGRFRCSGRPLRSIAHVQSPRTNHTKRLHIRPRSTVAVCSTQSTHRAALVKIRTKSRLHENIHW